MGIRVTKGQATIESKRALKMISALSSYIFENECILKESEKQILRDSIKALNNVVSRNN